MIAPQPSAPTSDDARKFEAMSTEGKLFTPRLLVSFLQKSLRVVLVGEEGKGPATRTEDSGLKCGLILTFSSGKVKSQPVPCLLLES